MQATNSSEGNDKSARLNLPIESLAIFRKFFRRKYDESVRLNLPQKPCNFGKTAQIQSKTGRQRYQIGWGIQITEIGYLIQNMEMKMPTGKGIQITESVYLIQNMDMKMPNRLGNPNHGDWLFNPKHGDENAKPARESKSRKLVI
jgi:hypothetical protein